MPSLFISAVMLILALLEALYINEIRNIIQQNKNVMGFGFHYIRFLRTRNDSVNLLIIKKKGSQC